MRKFHIANEIFWVIASILALVFQTEIQNQVSETVFQWIYWVSVLQLAASFFINPLARYWLRHCEEEMHFRLAREILGMSSNANRGV